jgi:nicotinamide-nucleotide amidase
MARPERSETGRLSEAFRRDGRSVAVAESLTGGQLSGALAGISGSGAWFRGGLVAYASEVKRTVLGVPDGPVVSEPAVTAMARAISRLLDADVAIAVTGVAGPEEQDGQPPGTVWFALLDRDTVSTRLEHLAGEPGEIVDATCRLAFAWMHERFAGSG